MASIKIPPTPALLYSLTKSPKIEFQNLEAQKSIKL
jgi:hypothetical protein